MGFPDWAKTGDTTKQNEMHAAKVRRSLVFMGFTLFVRNLEGVVSLYSGGRQCRLAANPFERRNVVARLKIKPLYHSVVVVAEFETAGVNE